MSYNTQLSNQQNEMYALFGNKHYFRSYSKHPFHHRQQQ